MSSNTTSTPLTLDDAYNMLKGKGGDIESESILNDSNFDKKNNTVSFWSNKGDAAKVIERCRNSIISFQVMGDGIQLTIDRKAFRGMACAFRKIGPEGKKPRKNKING